MTPDLETLPCRVHGCARKPKPDSIWCRAHWDQLVDRVMRGKP